METARQQIESVLVALKSAKGLVDEKVDFARLDLSVEISRHTRPKPFRVGFAGLYFIFDESRWLRIGQTTYSPIFTSQHYGIKRAGSSFAKDVWTNRSSYGYDGLDSNIGEWILTRYGRANLLVPKEYGSDFLKVLEALFHYHLKPLFEGRR